MLLGAGVLAQVAYPLTQGVGRDRVSVAVVVLLAAACLVHVLATRGPRTTLGVLVATAGVGLLAELVGTRTGVPFGEYGYAPGRLGPTVADVPLVVAAAWTVGAWPAWCAARAVVTAPAARVGLTALGLTAWDLYLDPQMLADGRWSFTGGGPALPGVPALPLTNLLGWACVGLVVGALLSRVDRAGPGRRDGAEPARGGDGVPVALYLWTWLGSGLAHLVFLGLPVSGVYGLLGMALLGVPLLRVVRESAARPARGQGAV